MSDQPGDTLSPESAISNEDGDEINDAMSVTGPRAGLRQFLVYSLVVVLLTAAMWGLHRFVPLLQAAEQWAADVRVATLLPREPQHPDIVIAAVTEETLEMFPYRSPLDRDFLAGLLESLAAKGARAVLIDHLFDQPTENEKDQRLYSVLRSLPMPVTVSYALADSGLTENQIVFLDAFVPEAMRGFANIIKDTVGGTTRAIYPGRPLANGDFLPGVVARLAMLLGHSPPREPIPIVFRGQPDAETPPFRQFPAHAVAFLPDAWIRDKIVLIGADQSLVDRHRTPFAVTAEGDAGYLPGVVIHAHALAQLMEGRSPSELGTVGNGGTIAVLAIIGLLTGLWSMPSLLRLVVLIVPLLLFWAGSFKLFELGGPMLLVATPSLAMLLASGIADFIARSAERSQKKFIQGAFSKYTSAHLLEELMRDPGKLAIRAERRELSIMFSDIAGFTTVSESLDVGVLSDLINRYRELLCAVVFQYEGTIVQFTGDGLYALFGLLRDRTHHAEQATACAMDLAEKCRLFSEKEQANGIPLGLTRIGVHTGIVSVGNFGSSDRIEYGAMGDSVNTASRVEGLNKYFATYAAVTGRTAELNPEVSYRLMGAIVLKGKTIPTNIMQPLSPEEAKNPYYERYRTAYDTFAAGELEQAKTLFRALQMERPDDGCVALHLKRLEEGETDVVLYMTAK